MRGRPFQLGNKYGRGRPPGSRNKTTRVYQDKLDSHGENLINRCVYLAHQGDPTALRLCMERLMPARRQRTVQFKVPPVKTLADVDAASESVVSDVARGRLTPAEGQAISGLLEGRRRVIETQEMEERIRALEQANQATPKSTSK